MAPGATAEAMVGATGVMVPVLVVVMTGSVDTPDTEPDLAMAQALDGWNAISMVAVLAAAFDETSCKSFFASDNKFKLYFYSVTINLTLRLITNLPCWVCFHGPGFSPLNSLKAL